MSSLSSGIPPGVIHGVTRILPINIFSIYRLCFILFCQFEKSSLEDCTLKIENFLDILHALHTRHDFRDFFGDTSLTSFVVDESEFFYFCS